MIVVASKPQVQRAAFAYYAPRRSGALSDAANRPSVWLSVPPGPARRAAIIARLPDPPRWARAYVMVSPPANLSPNACRPNVSAVWICPLTGRYSIETDGRVELGFF